MSATYVGYVIGSTKSKSGMSPAKDLSRASAPHSYYNKSLSQQ